MKKHIILLLAIILLETVPSLAQQKVQLNLDDAIEMAMKNNRLLNISRYQVKEKRFQLKQARTNYLPKISAEGTYSYSSTIPVLSVDQGAFGILPSGIPLPPSDFTVLKGEHLTYTAKATAYQPITQLMKVHIGDKVARTNLRMQENQLSRTELKIRLGVEKLYLGILLAKKQETEAQINVELAKSKLNDAQIALKAGKSLDVQIIGLKANLLDKKQETIKVRNKIDDYTFDLKKMLNLPENQPLDLKSYRVEISGHREPLEYFLDMAKNKNPELLSAGQTVKKADYGVRAARRDYIPDVGAFAQYQVQKGIPITPKKMAIVGLNLKWNLFEFGKKHDVVRERMMQRKEAQMSYQEKLDDITGQIEKLYRQVSRAQLIVTTARQALELRKEEFRIRTNAKDAGLSLNTNQLEAKSKLAEAESNLQAAELNYQIKETELYIAAGNSH